MTKEEYTDFISEISEMLGLGKPVDILKLCATTDKFVRPLQKRIAELEKENAILKGRNKGFEQQIMGLLIKYEEVYKRFPDLKSAMDKAQTILKENAELKERYKRLKERYDKVDIIGYDALKNLTKAENIIRELLFHLTNDTFCVTFETREQSVERAREFLKGIEK